MHIHNIPRFFGHKIYRHRLTKLTDLVFSVHSYLGILTCACTHAHTHIVLMSIFQVHLGHLVAPLIFLVRDFGAMFLGLDDVPGVDQQKHAGLCVVCLQLT